MRLPWRCAPVCQSTPTRQSWIRLASHKRPTSIRREPLALRHTVHRALLWIWKVVPFPTWLRQAYLHTTHTRFLIGVVALIRDTQGHILLFHHTYRRRWAWSMPGGYLELGESPDEGIARELREESGLEIRSRGLLAASFHTPGQLDLLLECEIVGGTPTRSPEISDFRYVSIAELRTVLPNHWRLLREAGVIAE